MNEHNYDAKIVRWHRCVERGRHTFTNGNDKCIECGAPRPGPQVTFVRGGRGRRP